MNGVSLFAGVGGFDLAMERNGIDVVASVEIDKAARGVLEQRFPNTQHFSDIKDVTGEHLRDAGFIPDSGVLVGGFPCQDVSVAGKRAGLVGRRSGLYWEIVRLIDELSPKWVVLENVPGLLSSNDGRDFGAVLGSLVERGYGVAYRILDAQHFGVPQRRRRVFIVGCLGDDGRAPFEVLALGQGVSGDSTESAAQGQDVTRALTTGVGGSLDDSDHFVAHTLTGEGFDASEDGTGRGVPLTLYKVNNHRGRESHDVATTLSAQMGTGGHNVPVLLTMREGKDGGGKGPLVSEDVSLTLATGNGQVLIQPMAFHQTQDPISGDISPALGVSSSGMGVMTKPFVKVVRSGARDDEGELPAGVWAERDTAPTMNAMDNTGEARATVLVKEHAAVRRLTPVECTRLQGFPDSWQEIHNANAIEAHADQILRLLWLSAYSKAREGWRPGISAALLTPEVLCAGVHGGWVSWEVAGECAASRGALQGEEPWPEGFLLEMRRCSQHRPSPYQRESFGQLAHELGRPLSAMPLSDAQARQALLDSELWAQASEEWPLRYARSETEGWSSPSSLADSARYRQMGNAVAVPVVEWIFRNLKKLEPRE